MAEDTKAVTKDSILEQIEVWGENARNAWIAKNVNEETGTRLINEWMDKQRDEIMKKAMGLSYSCGRWEVDHYNGRKTLIGDSIETMAKEVFSKWLAKEFATGLPKLQAAEKAAIMKEFRAQLAWHARKDAEDRGIDVAKALVEREFMMLRSGPSVIEDNRDKRAPTIAGT